MTTATSNLVSAAWMASAGPALVWTRSGGGANIVVLTDDQIAVGVLPALQLKTAKERLEGGEAIINVVGPRASYIRLGSVRSVSADLDGTTVAVEHSQAGGGKKTDRLRFADRKAQDQFVTELRDRLPPDTEVGKTEKNRWLYALRAFNLFIVLAFATGGVHMLFDLELHDRHATRRKLDEWAEQAGPEEDTFETRTVRQARTQATARTLARNPAVTRVLVIGVIVIGVVGFLLSCIGYFASMTIFGAATALSFCWMISRLGNPPRSLLLIVPARR